MLVKPPVGPSLTPISISAIDSSNLPEGPPDPPAVIESICDASECHACVILLTKQPSGPGHRRLEN